MAGRPPLENQTTSAAFDSPTPLDDLPAWIAKSEPTHLDLAQLGRQIWPDIQTMLQDLGAAAA